MDIIPTKENLKSKLSNLTEEQMSLVLQPSDAPKDFYCNGELNKDKALNKWAKAMRVLGLSKNEMMLAFKFNFS